MIRDLKTKEFVNCIQDRFIISCNAPTTIEFDLTENLGVLFHISAEETLSALIDEGQFSV
jgi:hypothetical protein